METNPTNPPLHASELADRCMGNAQIAAVLLDKFEKQLGADVRAMQGHLAAGDCEQLARTVHALKGAAGAVGAPGVRAISAELEALARSQRLDEAAASLEQLRAEVDRCLAYLPRVREQVRGGPGGPGGRG